MRYKNSDTIQPADDPAVVTGIRNQGERLRRRYLFNPGLNPRINVGNLKPRFRDINRGLPLLEHLQRYLPGGSSHNRISAQNLIHSRRFSRKDYRHTDLAVDKWPQPSAAVGQPPPQTMTCAGRL